MKVFFAIVGLLLTSLAAPAQEEFERQIYAQIEEGAQREYDHLLQSIRSSLANDPSIDKSDEQRVNALFEGEKSRLRFFTYNKASLFAFCSAEAARARGPNAPRVPAQRNIVLQSCLEVKLSQMTQFANIASYASHFFPERIDSCGDKSRQRDREQALPAYEFLKGEDELKLYDFENYVKCMMTVP